MEDLPRASEASIAPRKLTDYLLAADHPAGGPKARYFIARGYDPLQPELLERDLLATALRGSVESREDTPWGTKYFVVGYVQAPDGGTLRIGTVWLLTGDDPPVLVTAYPT